MRIALRLRASAKFFAERYVNALRFVFAGVATLGMVIALSGQEQADPSANNVTILLPPRLMAGHPATLAVLGVDGKLASDVSVDLAGGESVTTDRTGRAVFTAPANANYVVARAAGASTAALVDPAVAESEAKASAPPVVSTTDHFWICGAGLRGKADEDSVRINGEAAPVIAASPLCIVTLPPPDATPRRATISVDAPGVEWTATTTLVSLQVAAPKPALKAGEKGQILVVASGSTEKLQIALTNRTPGVLKFEGGDEQEVVTKGGSPNSVAVRVQAITSGDFSFGARLLPAANAALAERYLQVAMPLAPKVLRRKLSAIARQLAHRPQDALAIRAELDRITTSAMDGDFDVLLTAARDAL